MIHFAPDMAADAGRGVVIQIDMPLEAPELFEEF
jgi:hypothetical protein